MLVVVVALTACVDTNKNTRWPEHRKDHDARLDKLAQQVDADNLQIAVLPRRIANLEILLLKVPPPAAPAVAPSPEPAPAPPAAPSAAPIPASDLSH